jgi:hypothetical protein
LRIDLFSAIPQRNRNKAKLRESRIVSWKSETRLEVWRRTAKPLLIQDECVECLEFGRIGGIIGGENS